MKTLLLTALAVLVTSCRLDKLINTAGERPPPPASDGIRLIFTVQPGQTAAGEAIAPGVQVTVEDPSGHTLTGYTDTVTLTLGTNPSDGTLAGRTAVAPVAGVATFSDLSIGRAARGYALAAAAPSVSSSASDAFDVVPGPATQLVFTTQPSRTAPGNAISPPVRLTALDALGNTATNFTGVVQVALGHDGSLLRNAQLSGATSQPTRNGVATFADLRIDQIGNGYTLVAGFDAASPLITSAPFNVGVF